MNDMPSITSEPLGLIGRRGEVGRAFDSDPVIVKIQTSLPSFLMTSYLRGLMRHPFHHITVGAQHIRAVIYYLMARPVEVSCQPALR